MIIGLLIALLLAVLAVLFAAKELETKAAFFGKLAEKCAPFRGDLSALGLVFGLVAAILTVVMIKSPLITLIRLVACVLIIILAAPEGLMRIFKLVKYDNPVIIDEIREGLEKLTAKREILAYTGLGVAVLVFLTLA